MHRTARIILALSLPALVVAQSSGSMVFGSSVTRKVHMVELRGDGTFLIIRDTVEQHGAWSAEPGQIRFEPTGGEAFTAELANGQLTFGTKRLDRWNNGTTAAQFLSAFIRLHLRIQVVRAELRRDLQDLARLASSYRSERGSFEGFTLPESYRSTPYGTHEAQVTPDRIVLKGTGKDLDGAVQATVMPNGALKEWTYYGLLM